MAESVIMVCDVCGASAQEGVIIRVGGRNFAKDLCAAHLRELISGARTPKRGRRPGSTTKRVQSGAKRSTTKSKAKRAAKTVRRGTRRTKRTSAKRAA